MSAATCIIRYRPMQQQRRFCGPPAAAVWGLSSAAYLRAPSARTPYRQPRRGSRKPLPRAHRTRSQATTYDMRCTSRGSRIHHRRQRNLCQADAPFRSPACAGVHFLPGVELSTRGRLPSNMQPRPQHQSESPRSLLGGLAGAIPLTCTFLEVADVKGARSCPAIASNCPPPARRVPLKPSLVPPLLHSQWHTYGRGWRHAEQPHARHALLASTRSALA
jgi:hypothetical protein